MGTDGSDHAYRQKIVDRYKAAAKARSYLNGVVATAMVYHPLVLLSVFLPKKIVGNAVQYDIHNVPILATNGMQFLIVLLCAHASRQVPSKEKRVLSLSSVLILLGVLNIVFALMVRFREHPDVVDHKKVAWIGAVSIEKVMRKLIGAKRCDVLGVRANKMYPSLAQLEVFGEVKAQCNRIDAITLASRSRTIVKNMSEVGFTISAHYFHSNHSMTFIFSQLNCVTTDRTKKTRPS